MYDTFSCWYNRKIFDRKCSTASFLRWTIFDECFLFQGKFSTLQQKIFDSRNKCSTWCCGVRKIFDIQKRHFSFISRCGSNFCIISGPPLAQMQGSGPNANSQVHRMGCFAATFLLYLSPISPNAGSGPNASHLGPWLVGDGVDLMLVTGPF